MIRLQPQPWNEILRHSRACYPLEACGILLGTVSAGDQRTVTQAILCPNVYPGDQSKRFALDPTAQFDAQRTARELGLQILGFFHSHPDSDAYFSPTDIANSCPWLANLVLSIRRGLFSHARAFRVDLAQTHSFEEPLVHPLC